SGYILQDLLGGLQQGVTSAGTAHVNAAALAPSVGTAGCSQVDGTNVRANQDCTNDTSPKFPGRGQAQNETAIAVNPTNASNILAGQNDYRRGDATCGADFSFDGGAHWGNVLLPIGFSVPGVDHAAARHYWTSSGDPSVAFDSSGAAYYACGAF